MATATPRSGFGAEVDTATKTSRPWNEVFGRQEMSMLMFLIGFEENNLGKEEFETQRLRAELRKRLNEVRRMVFVQGGSPEKSTQTN